MKDISKELMEMWERYHGDVKQILTDYSRVEFLALSDMRESLLNGLTPAGRDSFAGGSRLRGTHRTAFQKNCRSDSVGSKSGSAGILPETVCRKPEISGKSVEI